MPRHIVPVLLQFLSFGCYPEIKLDVDPGGLGVDADGDGVDAADDCDDADAAVYPDAPERCNGLDDDCDGEANFRIAGNDFEDDDGDGFVDATCGGDDCDDGDAEAHPGATPRCDTRR